MHDIHFGKGGLVCLLALLSCFGRVLEGISAVTIVTPDAKALSLLRAKDAIGGSEPVASIPFLIHLQPILPPVSQPILQPRAKKAAATIPWLAISSAEKDDMSPDISSDRLLVHLQTDLSPKQQASGQSKVHVYTCTRPLEAAGD